MRKIPVRVTIRLIAGISAVIAFALVPALAEAQVLGSLTQLTGPNTCIESTSSDSTECTTTAPGLTGTD